MINIDEVLERASKLKIAVIGDLIIDQYVFGDVTRVSPEAPVPVLNRTTTKTCMGGAGNVFMNLINLGVDADLFCNFNQLAFWDESFMDKIFCNNYPAAIKTRVMSGQHHLLRVDNEIMPDAIEWSTFKQLSWWEHLQDQFMEYDCIVLADYHKGCLSDSLINAVMELATHYKIPVVVDAKKDFQRFSGATIIKCNKKEWEAATSQIIGSPDRTRFSFAEWNVVTCGEAGISLYDNNGNGEGVNGIPIHLVDVCGAGDTVTAVLAMAFCSDESMWDACELANIAASEVCQHSGVYAISKEDLIRRCKELNDNA